MNLIWVVLSAFVGTLLAGTLGWLESGESFNARKFISTVARGILSAAVFGLGYTFIASGVVSTMDIIAAFLGGAGVDVVGKRISGAITASKN